jgi:hypothetical protein
MSPFDSRDNYGLVSPRIAGTDRYTKLSKSKVRYDTTLNILDQSQPVKNLV